MTSFRLRPRFSYTTEKSPESVVDSVRKRLQESDQCMGKVLDNHVVLYIPPDLRHYWSPQLNLSIEAEASGCRIDGLFTPSPSVWGLFTLGYGVLAVLFLFLSIIGGSSYMLGESSWTLYALPVVVVLAIGLYFMSQVGQKIGAEQMFTLHHYLEDALQEKIHNLY